ncbi:hypothetical protein ACFCW2_12960 [Qipengyuania sp. DSG2-2]|uniref:hypothetical protein n=1 Tax=Qipengyuania sp. DGS2-2 TaxID=3349631 RepID=UPI0036D29B23
MFIGHFSAAFVAAAASRRAPSLPTLFVGAQLVDWVFFTFTLIGLEQMRVVPGITAMNPLDLYFMPYTHSLLGTAVWGLAFALFALVRWRNAVPAVIGFFVVLSHWILDLVTHRPDLTLAGGDHKIGLGLWDYPWAAISLELALILGSFAYFMSRTRGPIAPPLILIGVMLIMQAINWFGPEPTEAGPALYLTALLSFLIVTLIAAWVGATRWHKREVGLAVASLQR